MGNLRGGESRESCQGKEPGKEATELSRPSPSSEHPAASALSVSLLSAWIVAQLWRRYLKRLQGQSRQSSMSEKLVGSMKGRPGAGQGAGGQDVTPGYIPHLPQQPQAKASLF